jgi:hypothetical protein
MSVEIFDKFGQVDLTQITDDQVALLNDNQKAALVVLFDAVSARTAADARKVAATARVREAMRIEEECAAAHLAASPAPTFQEAHAIAARAYTRG